MKKGFAWILLSLAVLLLLPNVHTKAAGNQCGDNASWTFNASTKTLTISGTGAMYSYSTGGAPWNAYYSNMEHIVIQSGITEIGSCVFGPGYCYLPLKDMTIPLSVKKIGWHFVMSNNEYTINYPGTKAQWNAIEKSDGWNGCSGLYTIQCSNASWTRKDDINYMAGSSSAWSYNASTDTVSFTGSGVITNDDWMDDVNYLRSGSDYHFAKIVIGEGITDLIGSAVSGVTADSWSFPSTFGYYAGENVTWKYNAASDTVTFSGTGEIGNTHQYSWYDLVQAIRSNGRDYTDYNDRYRFKKIIIGEGISGLVSGCFDFIKADAVNLPSTLQSWCRGRVFFDMTPPVFTIAAGANYRYDATHKCMIELSTKTIVQAWPGSVIPEDGSVTAIGSLAYNFFSTSYSTQTEMTVPACIKTIEDDAFVNWQSLQKIIIYSPDVQILGDGSTISNVSISSSSDSPVIICGYSGSTAEAWAIKYNHPFEALSGTPAGGSWKKNANGWWYQRADGTYPKNQWEKISGKWYHFDAKGYMQTGWLKLSGEWYYLGASGAMQTGWVKVGDAWYYLKASGAMATGWQKIGSTWYYLNASGVMQTGWQVIGTKLYYFKSSGAMAAKEWVNGYYLNADGSWTYRYQASWKRNAKGWWYGDDSGWYAKNTTIYIDGIKCNFDASGYLK